MITIISSEQDKIKAKELNINCQGHSQLAYLENGLIIAAIVDNSIVELEDYKGEFKISNSKLFIENCKYLSDIK